MTEIDIDDFSVVIPECCDYNNFENIKVLEADELTYLEFFNKFMIKNVPCIVRNISQNWECAQKWIKNGCLDYDYFKNTYGHLEAPVADCSNTTYNSHSKKTMTVNEYIEYLNENTGEKLLYLKDWHLRRIQPDDNFYKVPLIFASDWLNEFAQDHQEDDYMFVYIGAKDTWYVCIKTKFKHSHIWQSSVTGANYWLIIKCTSNGQT